MRFISHATFQKHSAFLSLISNLLEEIKHLKGEKNLELNADLWNYFCVLKSHVE